MMRGKRATSVVGIVAALALIAASLPLRAYAQGGADECIFNGEQDCTDPCIYSEAASVCHSPGCAYTPSVDCQAPCVVNNNTFSCHEPDQSGDCSSFDFADCPARCFLDRASVVCRDIECNDYPNDQSCQNTDDELDCRFDEVLMECFGADEMPECRDYDVGNCPSDRCQVLNDAACVAKDLSTTCAVYLTQTECSLTSGCVWSSLYNACGSADGVFECTQMIDFLSCVDQDHCCFGDDGCQTLPDGETCDRSVEPCELASPPNCPAYCVQSQEGTTCTDPLCRTIDTNRTCSARDDCIFSSSGCLADGDAPCPQYNSSDTCPWFCEWDTVLSACADRPCTQYNAEDLCVMVDECVWDLNRCYKEGDMPTSTQAVSTPGLDIDCGLLTNRTDCQWPCTWNELTATCRNRTCTQIFDERSCVANPDCQWAADNFFPCTPLDTMQPCETYTREACPITRCTFANTDEGAACRNKTCADLSSTECANSTVLDCQYAEEVRVCHETGTFPACTLYGEDDCPSRCTYSVGARECVENGTVLPCSRFSRELYCEQQPGCEFASVVGLCINQTNPQYECSLLQNDQFCRDSPICVFEGGQCQECEAEDPEDCIQPCPDDPLPDCEQLSQNECFDAAACTYSFITQSCQQATCSDVTSFNKCLCESIGNCTFEDGTCKFVDDGLPCEQKTTQSQCTGAAPRCFAEFSESAAFSCRNGTCLDQYGEDNCLAFPYGDCEWLPQLSLCNEAGAPEPCTRIFNEGACDNSTTCTWYPDIALCYFSGEEVPCSEYEKEELCPEDRCTFYSTIPLCAPAGEEVPCSAYSSEAACLSNTACRYIPGAYACVDDDAPAPCDRINNAVACSGTAGCKYDGARCVACGDGEVCNGTSALQPCIEQTVCDTQYCFQVDSGCQSLSCSSIFSRFHCDALEECRYDPFTFECVDASTLTECEALPTEPLCIGANEDAGREETCEWNEEYAVCLVQGEPIPCKAFKNETVCNMKSYCEWAISCQDYVTTTTTTTTTTTSFVNGCENNPCYPGVVCTPGTESGAFTCGECPVGTTGDGQTCTTVKCPEQLSLSEGQEYLFGTKCFFLEYDSECKARCDTGFEQEGNGTFVCNRKGEWVGELKCTEIDPCDQDPPPCDPLTECTKTGPNSFQCSKCPTGYINKAFRPKTRCENIDECEVNDEACHPRRECIDTMGSYTCGPCEPGWREVSDTQCEDIPECTEQEPCYPGVACTELDGSYKCGDCPTGYVGNGLGEDGCTIVTCPLEDVPDYPNTTPQCDEDTYGSTCVIGCNPGYSSNFVTIQCLATGEWTEPSLVCEKLPCPDQPSAELIPEGAEQPSCAGAHMCQRECKPGYAGSGNPALTCPLTSWEEEDAGDPFTCTPCDLGVTYQPIAGATACLPVTEACGPGRYEQAPPTTSSDRRCRRVTERCTMNEQYAVAEPTPTSDRQCADCSACSSGTFRSSGCDGLVDAVCTACSSCSEFEYEVRACTPEADTRCETCPFGTYYSVNTRSCLTQPHCFIGWIEEVTPTPVRARECKRVRVDDPAPDGSVARIIHVSVRNLNGSLPLEVATLIVESVRRVFADAGVDVRVGILNVERQQRGDARRRRATTETMLTMRVEADEGSEASLDGTDITAGALSAAMSGLATETQGDLTVSRQLREAAGTLGRLSAQEVSTSAVGATTTAPSASTAQNASTTGQAGTSTPANSSAQGGTDESTLYIIIGVVCGVVFVAIVVAIVVTCRASGRSKGASISGSSTGAAYQENAYADVHELMAVKTLETTARAPVATRATRQGSFYSSINQAASEI